MKVLPFLAAAALVAVTINSAVAQQRPSAAAESSTGPANEVQEVIVTGTRRLDRTAVESAAPIDVLSGADLET